MARGNWNPNVIKPKPRCRLCRFVVKDKDFVRLDGIYPAHKTCAVDRGRLFTEGKEFEMSNEEKVKSKYPEAHCVYSNHSGKYMIYLETNSITQHIEWQNSKKDAWAAIAKVFV